VSTPDRDRQRSAAFARVLADLRRCLVPGGRVVFDSRDPEARLWERWNPVDSRRQVAMGDGQEVAVWTEVTGVRDGTVSFTHHYTLPGGEELVSTATLRFRTEAEVRDAVRAAGFEIGAIYGGWKGETVGAGDGELLVVARK